MNNPNESLVPQSRQDVAIAHQLEEVKQTLIKWRDKAHLLTPFCRTPVNEIPEGWKVSFRSRVISTKEEDGEVYLVKGTGRYALTKLGLVRLDGLAGVEDWKVWRVDDTKTRHLCIFKASAQITDVDGTVRKYQDGYTLDLRDDSEQAKVRTPDQLSKDRQNIDQLAASKAKNRVRRELLGLQSSYKKEDLEKPFIILRMVYQYNSSDPVINRLLAAKQLGLEKELFSMMQAERQPIPSLGDETMPAGLPPAAEEVPIEVEPIPGEEPQPDLDPDEIAALQKEEARAAKIKTINELYLAKKGKSRAELSPTKPALEKLEDNMLDQIEAQLRLLSDLPPSSLI
jgi:hypothetical protein